MLLPASKGEQTFGAAGHALSGGNPNLNRAMWEREAKSRSAGTACNAVLLVLTVCIVGCAGDVRSVARCAQCQNNLRTLYDALVTYVSLHGDLPRGKDGQVSIDPLVDPKVQKEVGIDAAMLTCPADMSSTGPSYMINPNLTVEDLSDKSATVVACDRLPNHSEALSDNDIRLVLIGDGSIVTMNLPLKQQEEWGRLFLSGDKCACTVSARDGSRGNWTSADVMWYVGGEKGYVQNEALP